MSIIAHASSGGQYPLLICEYSDTARCWDCPQHIKCLMANARRKKARLAVLVHDQERAFLRLFTACDADLVRDA